MGPMCAHGPCGLYFTLEVLRPLSLQICGLALSWWVRGDLPGTDSETEVTTSQAVVRLTACVGDRYASIDIAEPELANLVYADGAEVAVQGEERVVSEDGTYA